MRVLESRYEDKGEKDILSTGREYTLQCGEINGETGEDNKVNSS